MGKGNAARARQGYTTTCSCGKRAFQTRKLANVDRRRVDQTMHTYRCPIEPAYFHNGHMPTPVKQGIMSGREYLQWRSGLSAQQR